MCSLKAVNQIDETWVKYNNFLEVSNLGNVKSHGNKLNNNANNLEWVTPGENMKHAYDTNLRSCIGELNTQAKLTETDVVAIRKQYVKGSRENNTYKLAKEYGVSPKAIENIVKRKTWTHI